MDDSHLYLIWTSGDPLTAEHMVLMYATNSLLHHWWKQVTVIVWGSASRLLAEDERVQKRVRLAQQAGVEFTACSACADTLGIQEQLEALDVVVTPWGQSLTELLQNQAQVLSV